MPNATVTFYQTTWANFQALTGTGGAGYTAGGLYFITDRSIIMRASSSSAAEEYGGRVQLVNDFPSTGDEKQGFLYIKASAQTGKIWNGSAWVTVFAPASSVTIDSSVTDDGANAVSGAAVHSFVTGYMVSSGGSSSQKGKIPTLNASGKLDNSFIPAVAISEYLGTKTTLAGLQDYNSTAEKGDWAKVDGTTASENGSYICTEEANSENSNTSTWVRLADKLDEITTTGTITEGSTSVITSGAIYTALNWQTVTAST